MDRETQGREIRKLVAAPNIVLNVVLGAIAAVIAYGRLVVAPF
jgi:hypothetical protein